MIAIRGILRRNRGLLAALGLVAVVLPATSRFWLPGPRASWTETVRPGRSPEEREIAEFVVFSPDARFALTSDGTGARLRDLATGRVRELSPGEFGKGFWVDYAQFLDGGRFVLGHLREPRPSGPFVQSYRIWEAETGREWARFGDAGDDSANSNSVVSADGSTFASPPSYERKPSGRPRSVRVWKPAWGREVRTFPGEDPIALSANGRFLAAGGPEKPMATVLVHDLEAGRPVATIPVGERESARCLALSDDGKILAEDQMPGMILWDVPTATCRASLETNAWPVRFGGGSSALYLGPLHAADEPSEVWNLAVDPPRLIFRGTIEHASPDGRRVVAGRDAPATDTGAKVAKDPGWPAGVDQVHWFEKRRIQFQGLVPDPVFRPDGRLAARYERRPEPARFSTIARYLPRAFRPNLVRYRVVEQIRAFDTGTGRVVATIDLPEGFPENPDLDLLADGKTLAVHYVKGGLPGGPIGTLTVELWDVPAGWPAWTVAAGLGVVAVGLGLGYDIRSRRRANRSARVPPEISP